MLAVFCNDGRGESGQRRQSHDWFIGRQRDAACGGEADAQTGKAAGTGRDGNAIQRGEGDAGGLNQARNQRHQGFGVAALHRLRFLGDDFTRVGVEHGGGAGIERRIDSEDQHGRANSWRRTANGKLKPIPRPFTVRSFVGSSKAPFAPCPPDRSTTSSWWSRFAVPTLPAYTGRTSTTSGMKCFNRFWMPCCSVAVDEGQPAHEPFMLR